MSHVIFIFHRDLRIVDHNALHFIKETYADKKVIPIFVFTPEQVTEKNKVRSLNSVQFMIQSLMDLNDELRAAGTRLHCFYGDNIEVLDNLSSYLKDDIAAVVETKDHTPYAKQREHNYRLWTTYKEIEFHAIEDVYLTEPGSVRTGSGKTFQKFTPFWTSARAREVPHPRGAESVKWHKQRTAFPGEVHLTAMRKKLVPVENRNVHVKGGRAEGLRLLKSLPHDYGKIHDIPSKSTSNLSAHNHFGTVSIREVFWAGKKIHIDEFIRQLYWRDFYGHIMNDFVTLYKMDPFEFMKDPAPGWKSDRAEFEKWCEGKTGHTLVDAGMKQLNETGYIHNRARLVAASYLAKELKIHWRWGEQYFAQKLVDYDVTQNMMNWIWVSSVLPFASAPFRRLDPEVQAKKFDAEEEYRNTWLK